MMIYMLAAAMTVAMLIATLLGMHQETVRIKRDLRKLDHFGFRH